MLKIAPATYLPATAREALRENAAARAALLTCGTRLLQGNTATGTARRRSRNLRIIVAKHLANYRIVDPNQWTGKA